MPNLKSNVIEEESINERNIRILKENFPNAIAVDEDGKYIVDPAKLQMSIDPSKVKVEENGYGLNWVGKKEAYHNAFTKNNKILKPLKDDSKDWDTTENILIKGDNIDALKILKQNYFEKIKMIYIDPPYNTKSDAFVYNDNFTSTTEETLDALGYDKEYIDYIDNIKGAKTHSGWLTFMYPRLLLARDLLKEDGVIFISIDDNEVAQLKIMCDEVFGSSNFISQFVWQTDGNFDNQAKIKKCHEYILLYSKNESLFLPPPVVDPSVSADSKLNKDYIRNTIVKNGVKNPESDIVLPIGFPTDLEEGELEKREDSWPKIKNKATIKNSKLVNEVIVRSGWSSKDLLEQYINNNCSNIFDSKGQETSFVLSRTGAVEVIKVRSDNQSHVISVLTKLGGPQKASSEVDGFNNFFNGYPKPTVLLKYLTKMVTGNDFLILDFFAGSGTTSHAIIDLNKEDGGSRKFVLVQIPEETFNIVNNNKIPKKGAIEAFKAGYETIYDITAERIRRAGDKIKGEYEGSKDLLSDDSYSLDIGFRAFEVVSDEKQIVYQKSFEEVTQDDLELFINPDHEDKETILYNLLVAEKLMLSTKVETVVEDAVYKADNVIFILESLDLDKLSDILKSDKEIEYITVYSPLVTSDKFNLELESVVTTIGFSKDKLKFRG